MRNIQVVNADNELFPTPGVAGRVVTVGSAAVQLGAMNVRTRYVLLQVQAHPIRLTYDGTAPTDSVGLTYAAATQFVVNVSAAKAIKAIRSTGSDATVYVQEMTR